MTEKLGICIVGCGYMGGVHAEIPGGTSGKSI
jgi:hypothetical protein